MDFETLFQLDPRVWPLAVMAFLRVVSVFLWLPVFGNASVPGRVRLLLAFAFVVCLWPVLAPQITAQPGVLQWSPLALLIATLREVFFGFAVGFSARAPLFAVSISSNLIGFNMGFQTASLFSPDMATHETALTTFKTWILVLLIFTFNVHHHFLIEFAKSFVTVPIGTQASASELVATMVKVLQFSFELGLRLSAPVLAVQLLSMLALGLLNRMIPQLNVFILNFPLTFLLSLGVLFLSTSVFIRLAGQTGSVQQIQLMGAMSRVFHPADLPKNGGR